MIKAQYFKKIPKNRIEIQQKSSFIHIRIWLPLIRCIPPKWRRFCARGFHSSLSLKPKKKKNCSTYLKC